MINMVFYWGSIYADVIQDLDMNGKIQLQYVNTSNAESYVSISNGVATCTTTNRMSKNYPSSINMVLQRSKDKNTYSNVACWNKVYNGVGMKSLIGKENVSTGYYYRLKTVVKIYSGSTSIETITVYSSVKYY